MKRRPASPETTLPRKKLPQWIRAVGAQLGLDPEQRLKELRASPTAANDSAHKNLIDALVAEADAAFGRGEPLVFLELLAAVPGILCYPKHGEWSLEKLRDLFNKRAYYAFSPFFGQRLRPERRKNAGSLLNDPNFSTIARSGHLRAKDIPAWIREFQAPEQMPMHVFSNNARLQPFLVGHQAFLPFFQSIAKRARKLASAGQLLAIIELLDVFPHYLHHIEKFPWLPNGLASVFAGDFPKLFKTMRERLGRKLPTDSDLITHFTVEQLLVKFDPFAEEGTGRIVPSGRTRQEVVDSLANVDRRQKKHLSPEERSKRKVIDKQLQRAKAKLKDYYGK